MEVFLEGCHETMERRGVFTADFADATDGDLNWWWGETAGRNGTGGRWLTETFGTGKYRGREFWPQKTQRAQRPVADRRTRMANRGILERRGKRARSLGHFGAIIAAGRVGGDGIGVLNRAGDVRDGADARPVAKVRRGLDVVNLPGIAKNGHGE